MAEARVRESGSDDAPAPILLAPPSHIAPALRVGHGWAGENRRRSQNRQLIDAEVLHGSPRR